MCQRTASILWLLVFCLLVGGRTVDAAQVTGLDNSARAIKGIVNDQQGAVITRAYIKATNIKTGESFTARSGDDGMFAITGLELGDYEIQVAATGFANSVMRITINADSATAPHSVELQVATVQITVTMHSAETFTTCVVCGYTYFSLPFRSLPLIERDPQELVRLQAGVTQHLGAFSINGSRRSDKTQLLDGFDDRSNRTGRLVASISLDSVSEFNSDYYADNSIDSSYGQNRLPQLSSTTRSGTNNVHADAYWYGDRTGLDANSFFNNRGRLRSDSVLYDQAGIAIGAPIGLPHVFSLRDHAFFFGSFERTRDERSTGRQVIEALPGFIERTSAIQGPLFRALLSSGAIPVFSGAPVRVADVSGDGLADIGDVIVPRSTARRRNLAFGRVDIAGTRLSINARYAVDQSRLIDDFSFDTFSPASPLRTSGRASLLGVDAVHVINPQTVNSTRISYSSWRAASSGAGSGSVEVVAVNTPLGVGGGVPEMPQGERGNGIFFADTYTRIIGSHTLNIGGQAIKRNEVFWSGGLSSGAIYYSDLLALVNDGARSIGDPARSVVQVQVGQPGAQRYDPTDFYGFATDSWRPGPRSVINLGLGYNFYSGAIYEGARSAKKDFAPSIAFAHALSSSEAVILRGGASIVYAAPIVLPYDDVVTTPLYPLASGFAQLPELARVPLPDRWTGQSTAQTIELNYADAVRPAYTGSAFFSVQHSHGRLFVLDAGYNMSLARHLTTFYPAESSHAEQAAGGPNSTAARGFLVNSDGNSSYHSLQVRVTSRQRRHFVFQAHYTLSKSIDTVSTDGPPVFRSLTPGPIYGGNVAMNRALSDSDRRHRAVGFFLWTGPDGKRWPKLVGALAGGWEVAGIVTIQSGPRVTLYSSGDFFGGRGDFDRDGVLNDRLALLGSASLRSALTRGSNPADSYFNPNLFGAPDGVHAPLGRNVLPAPGYASVDLAFQKKIRVAEGQEIALRAESFNVTNRVNFAPPVTDLVSMDFGRSREAGNSRIVRLSVRYRF